MSHSAEHYWLAMSRQKIYVLRLTIALLVYLFFKVTSESFMEWSAATFISLAFTIITVMVIFEILDVTQRHLVRNYKEKLKDHKTLIRFYWTNCLIVAPVVLAASFIHVKWLVPLFHCENCGPWQSELMETAAQGLILSWLIILAKTFLIYMEYLRKSENEKALLQKELAQSKFESLKDQIKPHFLFNSFSVLTSIIEEDPNLAVEFVGRLAKIYRYVLDNTSQLVSLDTELKYMEHYIFLLKTRHRESLKVDYQLNVEASRFQIPILSLQMLIENALKHNYFSKDEPLVIEIFNEDDQFLVVRNNLKKRELREKPTKLGLQNIMNRYQMLLDQFIIVKEDEDFFTVKLPLIAETKNEEA